MKAHILKCVNPYFQLTWEGKKPFELRVNDRDYEVGDILHLREWYPNNLEEFTGDMIICSIKIILNETPFASDFVYLGIDVLACIKNGKKEL